METADFPELPGFLFKGPLSDTLAFVQPVIYSGVCSRPPANGSMPHSPAFFLRESFILKQLVIIVIFIIIIITELWSSQHMTFHYLIQYVAVGFDLLVLFNQGCLPKTAVSGGR